MRTFFESIQKRLHLRFIAITPQERNQGLMFQKPLQPNEGALFVYEHPTKAKFWNKHVDFPIDIGFFDTNEKLFDIKHLEANQEKEVGSTQCIYVLEVHVGFFSKKDIGKQLKEFTNDSIR